MALNARGRFNKSSWIECHPKHCFAMEVTNPNTLLLGDSIKDGLARYQIIWKKYFLSLNAMNLGTGGDRVEMFSGEPSVYCYHHSYEVL